MLIVMFVIRDNPSDLYSRGKKRNQFYSGCKCLKCIPRRFVNGRKKCEKERRGPDYLPCARGIIHEVMKGKIVVVDAELVVAQREKGIGAFIA